MKTNIYLTAFLAITIQGTVQSQTPANQPLEYTPEYWKAYINKLNLKESEKIEFLQAKQNAYLNKNTPVTQIASKPTVIGNQNQLQAAGCNNIDFETGNSQGWTLTSGYHPIFNALGCCQNAGGQQLIVSTNTAVDPFGGFPVTAPGGNFSMKLGNSLTGGEADRIEQTFFVTAANANFTYKYAVVFEDPGHTQAEQPSFVVEMFDTTNTPIPCTYYNVSAGQNIPGFLNAANGVVYKPWSSVIVDLTNYIGQNVTIRFTTYDCALGGHFGYAYIDGNCAAFVKGNSDSICAGSTKNICAPSGFGSYTWNGPTVSNQPGQCLTVSSVGVYTCSTTMMTNCQGPDFTYTISNFPNPVPSFVPQSFSPCALQYTFANTSTISAGSITSYTWNLGNNIIANSINTTASYAAPGAYQVSLTATSNHGCIGNSVSTFTIFPVPNPNFMVSTICQNSTINFTNTSSIPVGSIISYTWNFGNNQTSNQVNPNAIFNTSGNNIISLTAVSNHNCVATYTNQVTVNPIPNVNFSANAVCMGQANVFQNLSTISSGNITNFVWNFNNLNTSTVQNPNYTFPNYGVYPVILTAISNNNCIASVSKTVSVYANPIVNFSAPSACANNMVSVNNNCSVANGLISSYNWSFSGNAGSTLANPSYIYTNPGTYTVGLTITSNHNCTASGTQTISIYALPQVNFTSNNACLMQTTQFNNSTIISNGYIAKWRWDFENDGIWNDTSSVSPNYVYPVQGNYNVRLIAISNHNCPGQMVKPVVVYPNPKADFKANSTCSGDRTDFVNLSYSPNSAITSYQWQYYGDGNISNIYPNAAHNYTYSGIYLVKLEVQNEFGCTNVMSKPVYVNPKPVAMFDVNKFKGCESLCVTFTNQSSISGGNIVTTQWQFGDGSLPSYVQNPKHCYNNGKYDVTLKLVSDSGCMATYVNHAMIEVYPQPVASFITEPKELDELEPLLTVTSDAVGATQTTYYINDGYTTMKENFSHTFTNLDKQKPIIFQVVSNKYGCADTTSRIINLKQSYAIYIPNTFTPNYDGLNDGFRASGYNIIKFNLQIFDRWGKKIFETNDMNVSWDGHTKDSDEPIKDDVYVWKANVTDINNKAHDLVGHVTLLK